MNRKVLDKITNASELDANGEDGQLYLQKALTQKELLETLEEAKTNGNKLTIEYITQTIKIQNTLQKAESKLTNK